MKRLVVAILSISAAVSFRGAFAVSVDADQAKTAAQAWIDLGYSLDRLQGKRVESVETLSADAAEIHVAKLQDGGFVVLSADDEIDPVIVFSDSGETIDQDERNPLWALLKADLAARAAATNTTSSGRTSTLSVSPSSARSRWAELLSTRRKTLSVASISDVRVEPFLETKWNQSTVGSKNVYNYYTPNNYVCGCVATATAQVMRHNQWPTSSVTAKECTCSVDGTSQKFTMQGGTYDWSNMPAVPTTSITEAQQQAIGKLTYDIGCSVGMSWASGGSGASIYSARLRLMDTFGYKSCEGVFFTDAYTPSCYPYSLEICKQLVIPSLEYGALLEMSVTGAGGHAVVVDGYGYSGNDFYMHVNCGWGGSSDAWYCPPDLTMGYYPFNAIDGFLYHILPQETGTIISGRVLDAGGSPVTGATVELKSGTSTKATTTTNSKGVYAVLAPRASKYSLVATSNGSSATLNVTVAANVSRQLSDNGGFYPYESYNPTIGDTYGNDILITGLQTVATPVVSPGSCSFESELVVTVSCETEGVTLRYTLDGSDPTETSAVCSGSLTLTDTATLKVRAYKTGMNASLVAEAAYSRNGLTAALDAMELSWTTSSDYPWVPETSVTRAGVDAAQTTDSGDTWTNEGWLQTEIVGPATLSFYYKTTKYRGTFYVDVGETRVYEETDDVYDSAWAQVVVDIPSGKQLVTVGFFNWIVTSSDRSGGRYSGVFNGAYVDSVEVSYPKTATSTTSDVPVPYTWLDSFFPGQGTDSASYETLGNSTGANGYTVWQSYLAGLDPTDADSTIDATIRLENGVPVVEWNVTNANAAALGYIYNVKGKRNLSDDTWSVTNSASRFFKVFLEKQ